ncbi:acetyl-CoA synthetase-like protein, partial [Aureobasidium melanogenum]
MTIGQRLIPQVINDTARSEPESVWAAYPLSIEALAQGDLTYIKWKILSNSINRLAWWLIDHLGHGKNLETLCYVGPSDIRYFIFAVAACKAGFKALFSSPRNHIDAHVSLIEKTQCRTLVGAKNPVVDSIVNKTSVEFLEIPSLEDLLEITEVEPFLYDKNYHDVAGEAFLVLHTSGSTGLPKPVEITHGLMACIDAQKLLPMVDGRHVTSQSYRDTRVYTALPPFHSAGINFFGFSVFQGTQLVLGPPDKIPSLDIVQLMLEKNLARAGVMAPAILEEVAQSQETLNKLSSWDCVSFGGGPLSRESGNTLSKYTNIYNILGSTETKNLPELTPAEPNDWQYHEFHPALGIEFRHHSGDLHELVFKRQPEDGLYFAPFRTFPELTEYPMKDLYSPHPTKQGLWLYQGRADDIVVLNNGEKFNPIEAEQIVSSHPEVKAAIIVGASKDQPAVLIEPMPKLTELDEKDRTDSVWDLVSKANEVLPGHAKVDQAHTKILEDSEAFSRSTKGTVQRRPTAQKLEGEIEKVYENAESSPLAHELDFDNMNALCVGIAKTLSAVGLRNAEQIKQHESLFTHGLDSLQTLRLSKAFQSSLNNGTSSSALKTMIYNNPTIDKIAQALTKYKNGEGVQNQSSKHAEAEMKRILNECLDSLESVDTSSSGTPAPSQATHVLLTGSTGGLGSYVLDVLVKDPNITVTCLNRAGSDCEKQKMINAEKGLNIDFTRVEFEQVDLNKPCFGLSEDAYRSLSERATHVIHNAWSVNFNLPVTAFEDQIWGCRNLIAFSMECAHQPQIQFISSVGAANRWSDQTEEPVPEKMLEDLSFSEGMGYAQSKQVSEMLFDSASKKHHVPSTICRVGQITGPVKHQQGRWNDAEWFPSLIKTSMYLSKLPASLGSMGRMDWIPVDILAKAVVEILLENPDRTGRDTPMVSGERKAQFVHLVNPHEANWEDILPYVQSSLDKQLQVVAYEEWLSDLQASADGEHTEANPAVKLLDFFEENRHGLKPKFSTINAQEMSETLASLEPINGQWMELWMKQWGLSDAGLSFETR